MSRTHAAAVAKAATRPDFDPNHGSASMPRDSWPVEHRGRRCACGCGGRITHAGGANGVALMSGCHMSVLRWVKETS